MKNYEDKDGVTVENRKQICSCSRWYCCLSRKLEGIKRGKTTRSNKNSTWAVKKCKYTDQ